LHSKPAPINDVAEFPCDKCGKCCENVHLSNQTRWLNRGDGVCRYFDTQQRNCSIYASRPDICRVKTQFDLHYKQQMSWDAFVAINLSVCEQLLFQSLQRQRPKVQKSRISAATSNITELKPHNSFSADAKPQNEL